METTVVPPALRDRLGHEGTLGLIEFMQATHEAWRDDVVEVVSDRFEQRLSTEIGGLRVEMVNGFATLRQEISAVRQEMTNGLAAARMETANGLAAVRQETANGLAAVRQEMTNGFMAVRKEMSEGRVDFIKWSFLFWIGQVAVLSGVMALLLRSFSPR